MSFPDLNILYGWGDDGWQGGRGLATNLALITSAANLVIGCNPPYSAADFLALYPQFAGTPTLVTGSLTLGSPILTMAAVTGFGTGGFGGGGFGGGGGIVTTFPNPPNGQPIPLGVPVGDCNCGDPSLAPADPIPGWMVGQLITGPGIPTGTFITAITVNNPGTVNLTTDLTLSNNATATINPASLILYTEPKIPIGLLTLYVNLAQACVQIGRWFELWPAAMGWFIAHYVTLYLRTMANPGTSDGALAASGAMLGFQTSKAAGDVSVSQATIMGEAFANWGAWNGTAYGQLFITWAQVVGAPGIYVW